MKVTEEFPNPIVLDGFTRILEIEVGVWEITNEKGESVFTTHCQLSSCGQPMFSKRIRRFYICRECSSAHHKAIDLDKKRKERYIETKSCFCGTEFEWSSQYPVQKYCGRRCRWNAMWRKRSSKEKHLVRKLYG